MVKRRGQSAAFMARIRKLRGKKKTPNSTKSKRRKQNTTMVKRRKTTKRRSYRRGSKMSGLLATGAGVGAYILFESMVEPKIIQSLNITNPMVVNVLELAAGVWASKKSGVVGQVGKAAIVINTYQLLYPYLSTLGNKTATSNGLFA